MTRQTVRSVCLLFLVFIMVLVSGLSLCERGLREISGMSMTPGALTLARSEETWILTLTGRRYSFDSSQISRYFRSKFADEN